jgi:hypothetical protein
VEAFGELGWHVSLWAAPTSAVLPLFIEVLGRLFLRNLYARSCIVAPPQTAIGLVREPWAGPTDHKLWGLEWACSVLYRRGTEVPCASKPANRRGLASRALLSAESHELRLAPS